MEKPVIIGRGAEAVLTLSEGVVVKDRVSKSYRLPVLDERIRKLRTRSEAKLISKANSLVPSPLLVSSDERDKTLTLEFVRGKKLSDHLEGLDFRSVCEQVGVSIGVLHDSGIIHGDLTTSNLILADPDWLSSRSPLVSSPAVFFIDFGLGFHSSKVEDKAVDLHLIRQALEAKHNKIFEVAFNSVLEGYRKQSSFASEVLKRLVVVGGRGRYKQQF